MAQKKQQDSIMETIQNNYVSALIGLIIVILGIGYIYNTIKAKNEAAKITQNQEAQEAQEAKMDSTGTIASSTYKVQKGDTLWSIAERKYQSGYNYTDIETANKLKSGDTIEVGQVLKLPEVAPKKMTAKNVIASPTVNPTSNPTTKPTITVAPTAKPTMSPTSAPTKAPEKVQKETEKAPITINGTMYTVVKGDNLWSIAVRAFGDGYKWSDIWKVNKKLVSNPNLIFPGQKLVLPRK